MVLLSSLALPPNGRKINKIMNDKEMDRIIMGAFEKATWLHKYLPFEFKTKWDQYKSAKTQGITKDTK